MDKSQINAKSQSPIFKQGQNRWIRIWDFGIGIYLKFGFWILGFLCRFKVRGFGGSEVQGSRFKVEGSGYSLPQRINTNYKAQ